MRVFRLVVLAPALLVALCGADFSIRAQKPSESEEASINALYREWSQATAARGGDGYASFFVPDGAVLPPGEPAVEGTKAIRDWIQKSLDQFTIKDPVLSFGEMRVSGGWATRRFTMTGSRVPRNGAAPVRFTNKYLDVLQKQPDGNWRFVYRSYSSNE
jgi:uncharacterized protein (TIGR02246 family)